MNNLKLYLLFSFTFCIIVASGQTKKEKWKGQAPIKKVNTESKPIQYQLKKTYKLGNGIYCSNEFDGARMNGIALTGDNEITVLITPENTPVNSSPWYAFKIWSETKKEIHLKITYNEGVGHRYNPKLSTDGKNWNNVDSTVYILDTAKTPKFCAFPLAISTDTTWVAAQELIVSKDIYGWANKLAEKTYVNTNTIGRSKEFKPIESIQIGNSESDSLVFVLSRQHPPEVTGWLAMKAFVERICTQDALAQEFRNKYNILVIPCVNPDGVDNGHWRHNSGGIDLNRDWEDFNQQETKVVRSFMLKKVAQGKKFIFAIDFHSTFHDIYYTIAPELEGNMPGLVPKVIQAMGRDIPGYDPNIKPSVADAPKINSTKSIFHEFGAEAITYEVGDNTPRELIRYKGELTAKNLMEIMLYD